MGVKSIEIISEGSGFDTTVTSNASQARAQTLQDKDGSVALVEDLLSVSPAVSPTQLTTDTDDWNPTGLATARALMVDISTGIDLTGIVAPASGVNQELRLFNISTSDDVKLKDADGSSSAANRFRLDGDYTIKANQERTVFYDHSISRWRAIGKK